MLNLLIKQMKKTEGVAERLKVTSIQARGRANNHGEVEITLMYIMRNDRKLANVKRSKKHQAN